MDLHLTGKTAVVTGASKGIGLEIVRALTAEGVRVVAAARTITPELRELDGLSTAVTVDLATPDGAAFLVERATEILGELDILINNVGGVVPGSADAGGFLEIADDAWQRTYELNLFGTVRVTRRALPSLLRRRGVIINISSIGARAAYHPVDYGTAKAALNNLTKALAEEFGAQGLRALTVSPGPTRTRNWSAPDGYAADVAAQNGLTLDEFLAQAPAQMGITTGRFTEPHETAALVTFLASPVSGNLTGADYLADGGAIKTV
ncbi:SDR family oxidoreductase [Nocardia transvalensis]|uniref:SDR family oxidoreductase n=1 Tax=Nocardia transvalensis TaxID=37333 RepID=UPI001892FFED|nr:SDR family oxidoreductase [Nocardia transvalensis]MBF6332965.1 SDR family oxidoreductase [Nocardia transvalensis]